MIASLKLGLTPLVFRTIQCTMAEISLNRISYNLENKLMDVRPFLVGSYEGKGGG